MASTNSGTIPGAAVPAPLLQIAAKTELETPPENFVGSEIFPDVQVASFEGYAPITWNDTLEAYDDDVVGLKADFPEIEIIESSYTWKLGFHARKVVIGVQEKIKAEQARAAAAAFGGGSDPMFALEERMTKIITGQNARHNELLKIMTLLDEEGYPDGNVFDPIAIETATADEFLGALLTAAKRVERAGKGPANMILLGDGASEGALLNANLRALMPDNAPKVLTTDALIPLLRLPEGQARVRIATATYRRKKKATPIAMMDNYIWIGRAAPLNGQGDGFGANLWHPCLQNSDRIYVNRMVTGNVENIHIGIQNFYRPTKNDGALGVLIPVTRS